jgi:hypothetical protein
MKRREFLASSIATAGLGTLLGEAGAQAREARVPVAREFYELRLYHLRRGPQTELFDRFYSQAAVPALNRAGVERVGVFNLTVGPDSPTMYVLLTHKSLESIAATPDRLAADAEYLKAGAEFLDAPATNPAYLRVESSLLAAFAGMPRLEAPAPGGAAPSRLFELRTYESHSKKANKKKIEMFEHGEIALFRRHGVQPVFFGETLVGARLPNLTYMVVFESREAHDRNWSAFMADPDWTKLRTTPGYADADVVSNISNVFLRPTAYSQI